MRKLIAAAICLLAAILIIGGCGGGGVADLIQPPPNGGDGFVYRDKNSVEITLNDAAAKSRLFDPDTQAVIVYLEGSQGYVTDRRVVNRRLGKTIFREVPNQDLIIVLDETRDLAGEDRIGKTTSKDLAAVPEGNTSWADVIYLGGSYGTEPTSLGAAVVLLSAGQTEGVWSEKQVLAGPDNAESPNYGSDPANPESASVYYGRSELFGVGLIRWTLSVLTQGFDEGTGQITLSLLDSSGTVIIDDSLISNLNGDQDDNNSLVLEEGLGQISVELLDGQVVYAKIEAEDDAITEFRWKFAQGTVGGGGEL